MYCRLLQQVRSCANITKTLSSNVTPSRFSSSRLIAGEFEECAATSDDGRVIAFWHPEKPILYEHTKPLPEEKVTQDTSVLRQANMRLLRRPKPDELVRQELMELTYTTKHRWFPRSRDRKFRKPPLDRPYL